jgi:hypothetical protein
MDKKKDKPSKEVNTANAANKKKARFAAYATSGRLEANKKRRMAKDEKRKAADAVKRPRRVALRKIGAMNRLDRRVEAAKKAPVRARLAHSRAKAWKAATAAVEAANAAA